MLASRRGRPLAGGAAWRLLDAGVADVIAWDGQLEAIAPACALAGRRRARRLAARREHLVGSSPAWRAVLREVVEVARFSDVDVLITGESGTGKELTARLIHALDARPHKRELVVVDCTTIVPELSGSEFFGHERGAFTGAITARDGAFALADGGTLFLDEVGELPLALQAELLRVVQEGTYKRVGSNSWRTRALPPDLRHEPRPARRLRRRHVPRRSVLPPRRRDDRTAPLASAPKTSCSCRHFLAA